ncbi:MAG: carboxypeptidase regulatory-like domain-containing protein, partial [Bryobacteraceae bacterium]
MSTSGIERLRRLSTALLFAGAVYAQTTQGLISGRVVDSRTGAPVGGATIACNSAASTLGGAARSDRAGWFVLPLLSPGFYRLRVEADRYQAQELQQIELAVAGRLDYTFRLRASSDVWEAGQYRSVFLPNSDAIVTFYGPDVDTSRSSVFAATRGERGSLETSLSQVIDSTMIRDLPFQGRDVYTMLVTQPGVTADGATARGLGLTTNGQRPSASSFLLDGLENNNMLVTGPLFVVAPEAIQEYRVSTSNFSAEYGRTSGFLANAISRSGGNEWHGAGYYYLKNEKLNANGFQQNLDGFPRAPLKESQPGIFAGGPIRRDSMFASVAFEYFRFRSQGDPEKISLPTTVFKDLYTAPGSLSRRLLEQYPAPPVTDGFNPSAEATLSAPSSVNRYLALPRFDFVNRDGTTRWLARAIVTRFERPDFVWSPYKDFIAPLNQNTNGAGFSFIQSTPRLTMEHRYGWSRDDLRFDRAHPEIPTLVADVVLPGGQNFYGYRNRGLTHEIAANLMWSRGRHVIKTGGGWLHRNVNGFLTAGRDGYYAFLTSIDFGIDQPFLFLGTLDRQNFAAGRRVAPAFDRLYRYGQFFGFVQDSFRLSPRLALNLGLRYESLGAPTNAGATQDAAIRLGPGSTLGERLTG